MGIDTKISLPPNVRVQDVASVMGALLGLPVHLEVCDGGLARQVRYALVRGASVKGYEAIPQMCRIEIRRGPDLVATPHFHFEMPGGRRLVTMRMSAKNIALAKAVVDFFGGSVDFCDCDDEKVDYVVADKGDDLNHPEDGEEWEILQRRLVEVKPLSKKDVQACESLAS